MLARAGRRSAGPHIKCCSPQEEQLELRDCRCTQAEVSARMRSLLARRGTAARLASVWAGLRGRPIGWRLGSRLVEPLPLASRRGDSWFLLATEGPALVGMASAEPLRGGDGTAPVIPGGCFLHFLFVIPERWGEGIGGVILDAVLAEAKRRHYSRIHLWTHKDNERSDRLYRSRGFSPTGRTEDGEREWAREI